MALQDGVSPHRLGGSSPSSPETSAIRTIENGEHGAAYSDLSRCGRGGRTELVSDFAACVWIPTFALRAEESRCPELAHKPAALLSPTDTRRLWQVSSMARRHGVKADMTVSQAIGLCPPLVLCEPDPVYYDEQFARILLALGNVSPIVEPIEAGKVFVGVDGLDRLLGDAEEQLFAIRKALDRSGDKLMERHEGRTVESSNREWVFGKSESTPIRMSVGLANEEGRAGDFERRWYRRSAVSSSGRSRSRHGWVAWARLGWARGKFAAWVAAAKAKPGKWTIIPDNRREVFLATQSIAALPLVPDTHHRLWRLGIKTLADIAKLPEEAVVAQFGSEGRRAWRLAAGAVDDPVIGRPRPEPIVAALDYLTPVADHGMLLHALGLLIDRALKHPRRIGWRVHAVRVRGMLENDASWMIEATLKDPSAHREHIVAPLQTRLELSPPHSAVQHLAVEFTEFVWGTNELQLFAQDARSSARAGRRRALRMAAYEIRTRLKRPMLYHVIEVHPWSRIPERRYALIDFAP